MDKFIRYII